MGGEYGTILRELTPRGTTGRGVLQGETGRSTEKRLELTARSTQFLPGYPLFLALITCSKATVEVLHTVSPAPCL